MLGRTYVFPLGRFGSVDPARDGWNLYGYVGANPMNYTDPTGYLIWKRGVQVLKVLNDKNKRTALVAAFRGKGKRDTIERTKDALNRIPEHERAAGAKRVVEVQDSETMLELGKELSTNGKVRGPERSPGFPDHVNPQEGPFQDVHVQVQGQRTSGSGRAATSAAAGALVLNELQQIFAPTLSEVSSSGDASPGELLSAAAWDITTTLDPIGASDLIQYIVDF